MLFRRRSQVDSTETFIDQHHCSRSAPSGTPCRRATRKLCSSISVRPVTCNSLGSVATATDAGRPGSVVLFAFTRHSSTFLICGAVISALSMGRFVDGDLRWRSGHVNSLVVYLGFHDKLQKKSHGRPCSQHVANKQKHFAAPEGIRVSTQQTLEARHRLDQSGRGAGPVGVSLRLCALVARGCRSIRALAPNAANSRGSASSLPSRIASSLFKDGCSITRW